MIAGLKPHPEQFNPTKGKKRERNHDVTNRDGRLNAQRACFENRPGKGLRARRGGWPQPKSSASEPLVVFKQALTTICSFVARKSNFNVSIAREAIILRLL
jgi:hypothetical protein